MAATQQVGLGQSNPVGRHIVEIATPRLLLRPLTAADLPVYHALRGSVAVMKYSPTHQPDKDEAATWVKLESLIQGVDGAWMFGVELLETPGVLVGDVGIIEGQWDENRWEGEVGYMLAEHWWGKGYATEALGGLVDAFWSGVQRRQSVEVAMTAITEENNVGSHRVLMQCGFKERRRFMEPTNGDRLIEMVLERPQGKEL